MSSSAIGLQSRPPLMLALGALDPMERSHLQIALRVVASKMQVPCTTVMEERGDIVFGASPIPMSMRITSAYGHQDVERPVRLVPLSDALSSLIDGILAAEGGAPARTPVAFPPPVADSGAAQASGAAEPVAAAAGAASPLAILLGRSDKGPLKIVLSDGSDLFVDAYYHSAWTTADPIRLANGAMLQAAQHVLQATPGEMVDADARLQRVSVEQLCWMGESTADNAAAIKRWSDDSEAVVRLVTWPNLSLQTDSAAWLQLIAALRSRPRTIDELQRIAPGMGIDAARLRYGIAMLSQFGHVTHTRTPASAAEVVHSSEPSVFANDNAPERSGLFGRLRSRLRSIVG